MANIVLDELVNELKPKKIYKIEKKYFKGVKIDSRDIQEGEIFIALVGKNHDAHKFIPKAFENGAWLAIVENSVDLPSLVVDDTFDALKKTASYVFKKSKAYSIAVTGSSGKTTTKELICSMIANEKCHKTKENENNFIGVSKTLLGIENNDVCVVEVGTNHKGEIAEIASFFAPDMAVFTNIGKTHIENFGSVGNILKEKVDIVKDKTKVIYNYDDLYLRGAFHNRGITCSLINPQADVYMDENSKDRIGLKIFGKKILIDANLIKNINIYNILVAAAAAYSYNPSLSSEKINTALKNFNIPHLRMQEEKIGKTMFILDCYNANPDSMKFAISNLNERKGRKLAIIGDMLELGSFSKQLHAEIGEFVSNFDMDIVTFGKDAFYITEYIKNIHTNKTSFFKDKEELVQFLQEHYESYDNILIKGSRGMKMEDIFYKLRGES